MLEDQLDIPLREALSIMEVLKAHILVLDRLCAQLISGCIKR